MANPIVVINVSLTLAPTPSLLQRTGAFISQGGTTGAVNSITLLPQVSTLAGILTAPQAIASITWLSSVATVTTSANHNYPIGSVIELTIAGATPAGYNGTVAATITTVDEFTYPLASNPGSETIPGTVVVANAAMLNAMNTTFFAQNGMIGVYVLELGVATSTAGIASLLTYIQANPQFFYSYLVPIGWDADETYPAFLGNFNAPNKMTYFFTTVTLSTYTNITALDKCAPMMIQATNAPATEFSMAAMFWTTLNANPSSSNKVPPLIYSFLIDVTAWSGTATQLAELVAANVNYVGSGAEGGISDTILRGGNMPDGNPWNFWYSADWVQINLNLDISNSLINNSNNNINPYYYDQNGVNILEGVGGGTLQRAISYGLALGQLVQVELDPTTFGNNVAQGVYSGQVVINAVPFATYVAQNPSQFPLGIYGGFSVLYTPARGFTQIIFNLNVSNLG